MKKLFYIVLMFCLAACSGGNVSEDVVVELQSKSFDFSTDHEPVVLNEGEVFQCDADAEQGFTLSLQVDLEQLNGADAETLFELGDVAKLSYRQHNPNHWYPQNYPAYKMEDGSLPVLEAEILLRSYAGDRTDRLVVGVPLAMLERPFSKHDVVLHFTGVEFSIYVDGKLYDNDFAIGYPSLQGKLAVKKGQGVEFYAPALQPTMVEEYKTDNNIQYWTPPFHNAWVGDVATIYHNGRYHIFYLFDRRGHASKLGRGGHYFEHLSTEDFKTWVEHEPAVPIDHQWETLGTGTPFVYDGKLCLAYGLHTTRIFPREKTSLPMMWDYFNEHKKTQVVDYTTLQDVVAAGTTYSVSADGVAEFSKSHSLVHPCENPSIFIDSEGGLRMLANYGARGEWSAESLADGWKCENESFPPGGDCTFFFEWGDYQYIIGGFRQLFSRRSGESDECWWDMVAECRDMYNGMSVPAVSEISDSRRLMAGWVKTQNWGGVLAVHEMVQFPDGALGSKWMEEIVPATERAVVCSPEERIVADEPSFILTFDVEPDKDYRGRVGVTLCGEDGSKSDCEWQLMLDRCRAQFSNAVEGDFAKSERTLREGGDASGAFNYAIAGGMPQKGNVQVRMCVYNHSKLRGSIVDVEIAGQRTMLSYRPDLQVEGVEFRTDGVKVKNIRKANLK
ncbi:MAG: hypothetical protein IKU22_09670 [Alistipes sp.]|nr:hypothetical protein [Alistipes sp.]